MGRLGIVLGLAASCLLGAGTPDLTEARKQYSRTEFDKSLKILRALPQKDASVYELIGRNHFMLGDYKKATEAFEQAAAAEPANSQIALWCGRAFGRRAETSSIITAPGLASRARQYFEKAVALDPHNLEALNDLFEYYLEAPGFLGGGFDKAVATSEKIKALNPVEGHWAQSKLAEKRKEFASAEEQLRRAAELAPQQVGRVLDLARFFAKHGRFQEADQTFARADKIAPNSPRVMFSKAEVYVKSKRNLDTARQLLHKYLASSLTPDDPPRSKAQKLLREAEGG